MFGGQTVPWKSAATRHFGWIAAYEEAHFCAIRERNSE
jgi:hypothetical protein